MRIKASKQRLYASLLILGAGILLSRSLMMLSQGALSILVSWVSALLIGEMLVDASCLLSSIRWWIANDNKKDRIPLRLGATAAILHAVRVLIFALGRMGPWIDFDLKPGHRSQHFTPWSWREVSFAAIMSVLGVIGVSIIWTLRRRARARVSMNNQTRS